MKKIVVLFVIGIFLIASRPAVAGGNDAAKVGIVAGMLAVIVGFATLGSSYKTTEREITNRRAIDSEERLGMEQIRSSTALASPTALGGNGEVEYTSPEGKAEIRVRGTTTTPVSASQYQPASPAPQASNQRCVQYYYSDTGETGCGPRAPRYQYPPQYSYGYGYGQYPHPRRIFRENPQTSRISKPDGTLIEMSR